MTAVEEEEERDAGGEADLLRELGSLGDNAILVDENTSLSSAGSSYSSLLLGLFRSNNSR